MITSLKVKNWRSHSSSEFSFGNGTNVLIGIMGAGKSSIMDAICFGLYGTCPALQQRKLKIEEMVMRGESYAEVEVEFKLGNDLFAVRRLVEKGKTSTSEIRKNGIVVESPQTSKVTENVVSLLKMDYDLFVRAVYAEQNSLDHFLTIPKGQRMKKLDSLLKLDKFEKARVAASNLSNKLSTQIEARIAIVERLETDESIKLEPILKDEILQLRKKMIQYQEERKEITQKLETFRDRIRLVESEQKKLSSLQSEKQFLESSINELETTIKNSESMFAQFNEIYITKQNLEAEVHKLKAQMDVEKQELEFIRTKYLEKRAFVAGESRNIEEIQKRLADIEIIKNSISNFEFKTVEEFKARIEQIKQELYEDKRKMHSFQKTLEDTQDALVRLKAETCPVCDTHLGKEALDKLIEKKSKDIEQLKIDIETKAVQTRTLEKILREQEETFSSFILTLEKVKDEQKLKEKLERSNSVTNEMKKECDVLTENIENGKILIEALSKTYDAKKEELTKLEWLVSKKMEFDEKVARKGRFLEKLSQVNHAIIEVNFNPAELELLRDSLENAVTRRSDIEARIDTEQKLLNEKEKRLAEIEEKQEMLKKSKAEIEKIENKIKRLKSFASALEKTQIILRQEFVMAVNVVTSEIWKNFYPYGDYSDARLAIEEGDYVLQILAGSGWVNVEGVASGGERNCAALSLRIAFALVLAPNLRWLILDEPTHNLDAKAIELLSEVLRDRIAEYVDQVFLITHEPRLEDAVSGVLYRLERAENKNSPTKAVRVTVA